MSQGDYLRRKRIANELRLDASVDPVFDSSKYLNFKEFQLQNTIESTNVDYSEILPTTKRNIYGMERTITNCPTFILCASSTRPNRVPLNGKLYSNMPLNWHQKNTAENAKNLACKCELNRSTTDENKCACVTGNR
tara:strand:- start:236 stop:643 length:408 start_codon:yes stop_codon:yes gene_type:complete